MEYLIAELIQEHKNGLSWHGLENAIEAANRDRLEKLRSNGPSSGGASPRPAKAKRAKTKAGKKSADDDAKPLKPTIDRRKLQNLAEQKRDVPLSLHELQLLDTFFIRNGGPGLAELPLFRRNEDLFLVLKRADRVSFFVGVRYVESLQSDMIARWDISALDTMRKQLPGTVGTESFVVPTRDVVRLPDRKEWETLLSQASGKIIASIGSPIACAGSERQMAQMFGISPYKGRAAPAPICFARGNANMESAFVCDPADVPGVRSGEAALLVDDQVYVSRPNGLEYGMIIAQRTGHEHASFVIAGISGPGTLAAASLLADGQIGVTLPRYSKKEKQPIVVAVVSTEIRRAEAPADRRIDKRAVANTRVAARPTIFEHTKGEWVVTSG